MTGFSLLSLPTMLNVIGLVLGLFGILILFRWGMPYRIRSDDEVFLVADNKNSAEAYRDRVYAVLGWVGVAGPG